MRGITRNERAILVEMMRPGYEPTVVPETVDGERQWEVVCELVRRGCAAMANDGEWAYASITDLGRLAVRVNTVASES